MPECSICGQSFDTYTLLRFHRSAHVETLLRECEMQMNLDGRCCGNEAKWKITFAEPNGQERTATYCYKHAQMAMRSDACVDWTRDLIPWGEVLADAESVD